MAPCATTCLGCLRACVNCLSRIRQRLVLPAMKSHRGTLILVLGILGLVICGPLGIVAWVMGSTDLKEIDAGRMDPTGRGLTQAGWIVGIVATVLFLISVVVLLVVLATGGLASVLHRA